MIPSQIFNFPPQSVPNVPNSEENHPTATLGIVDICLMVLPPPPNLLYHPALTPGTLSILTTLPAHQKDPISHPNKPRLSGRYPGLHSFLAGGVLPIYIDAVR